MDVPVIVRALSPVEALELALVENLQRADLTPVEEARAYQHLVAAGATLASIARHVGVPASRVRERLALLDLDQRVRERVHRGELPLRVALLLLPLRDHGRQWRLASTAMRRRLDHRPGAAPGRDGARIAATSSLMLATSSGRRARGGGLSRLPTDRPRGATSRVRSAHQLR